MIRFRTRTGSIYQIEPKEKRWDRIVESSESGPLRSRSGKYNTVSKVQVGKTVVLVCPPFNPEVDIPRVIETSEVEEIL